ncbi:bifunctional phosphoribosylaminoimidazolecarboxamide formyltransferase/IMP cyclohydrolase PurH [Bdellovibrio sp. qaytius]|nr:bifunctional phosphoribosylaminoimidazolecarboxamide formyltransferase/IMP cyclohydrolase PurH [Bdellovibrio sp. qaytius]
MKQENLGIKRALISVSDKTGIDKIAKFLFEYKVELISTGGTKKYLEELGLPVTSVESLTGNPEAFGGRMKSISFQVSSGLLFRRYVDQDQKESKALNINPIDLVICNLYPFEKYMNQNSTEDVLIENIDIGGPLMLRAAAKNYESVTVLSGTHEYMNFMTHFMENKANTSFEFRRAQAVKTFVRIAEYDQAIAQELTKNYLPEMNQTLRYGENPHQTASLRLTNNTDSQITLAKAQFIQGKELSYNNWMDADSAWRVMSDIAHTNKDKFVTAVIKHANPCGLAATNDSHDSLLEAWNGDNISAFGGIIACSYTVEAKHAEFLTQNFIEVLIAPDFTQEALELFAKKKNVRLLKTPLREYNQKETMMRSISGGMLIQDEDERSLKSEEAKTVTKIPLSQHHQSLVDFGVIACKHLKSNGIALVAKTTNGFSLVGTGMGQPNRLDSLRLLAVHRAKMKNIAMNEVLMISDAFFPFADSVDVCNEVGIKAIVQPGGSIRDNEVIAACDKYGISMLMTGVRHFRH